MIVARWDGRALLDVIEAAAARLQRDTAEVDALNVYPLPDGDTGRNMYQTIVAALVRAREAAPSVREVSAALAQGALMGARGNSGVILSQIMRGFREAFAASDTAGGAELREALARARANAFSAVDRPADGTMLSLCAAVDERMSANDDIAAVLRTALEAGADALRRTMEDNPLNRAAGVVDAGAYGIWLLLLGALERVDPRAAARVEMPELRRAGAKRVAPGPSSAEVASWTGGHCVQYLVPSPSRKPEDLRREMVAAGADSVLVVGDSDLIKVHAHAARPETITAIGESAGALQDLIVEDFDSMVAEHERATGIVLRSPPRPLGAIAIVPGDGFAEIARSFYVTPLRGGATMNPSVGEMVEAIRAANAETVVILPNDKNVILAAREAARASENAVEVVETTSVAQGMAALVPFDPMAGASGSGSRREVADVIREMREAARDAHGIEVTYATRETSIDGVTVARGEAIALVDGRLAASAADAVEALERAAERLGELAQREDAEPFQPEIVALYAGADVSENEAEDAAGRLRAKLPGAEVEVRRGGQPHYPYIVQVE
ncbi:MAG: DAK2 domain-containing protein [Candidatus Limnocylindria bacterium]